jgi:hypothetical protein
MTNKLAPASGVLFFVLLLLAVVVGTNSLSASSSPAKVLAYYASHRDSQRVSGVLTLLAVVIGVIFFGFLRDYLHRHETSHGLAATAFGGVILYAAAGALGAGAQFALADSPSHLSANAAQALNLVDMDVTSGMSLAGVSILLLAFGFAILKSALLPKWLGWVALPLAVIALIPPIGFIAWIGTGIWTLIVSIVFWRRLAADTAGNPAVPASARP